MSIYQDHIASENIGNIIERLRLYSSTGWNLTQIELTVTGLSLFKVPQTWPLTLYYVSYMRNIMVVKIFAVSAGDSSSSTNRLAYILDYFNADYSKEDIQTSKHRDSRGVINIKWCVDPTGALVQV